MIENKDTTLLPVFMGSTTKVTLPSGKEVVMRETNGDDDEVLSSLNNASDGSNVYNFLAGIIVSVSGTTIKPTAEDIKRWLVNDKYALLFKQRIFNYGKELAFKVECAEPKCKVESNYEEDLSQWDNDLGGPDYNDKKPRALKRYINGDQKVIEFTLTSGKKVKYSVLDGVLELKALELKDSTKNSPLIIRDLQILNGAEWIPVYHFAMFSSREMAEIRTHIKNNDEQFDPQVEFVCPNPKCGKEYSISLYRIGTFLYPEELT